MAEGLAFDERAARALERIYQTPDVVAQRSRLLAAMGLAAGARVLDVGVGPGLLLSDLARIVGEDGRAAGVDRAPAMVAMARARLEGLPQVELHAAEATALPFEDGSFDAATSTQVLEYVPEVDRALGELHRVLRPGGRAWVLDTDWDSVAWNTGDRARMRRVLDAWDAHLHDPHLPATLARRLRGAGLRVDHCEVIPLVNPTLHAHCYSDGIMRAIRGFVAGNGVDPDEAEAWEAELRALGARGDYFFSVNRYLFGASRP